ncbi:MAG: hypothetical protein WBC18_11910 [Ottowia sp.]|uniref:hypothetical protein n=1 Tax=Ottowia sp. TaxID=1898956 RepID=UPI003C76E63F
MKRRNALKSFSLVALPGLLAACGPGDSATPSPPPPAPSPADRWTAGSLLNAGSFGAGTPSLTLQADGTDRMLALTGPGSESLAFAINSATGSALTLQRPTSYANIFAAVPNMSGGMLWIWQVDGGAGVQQLLYALSDGTSGQIGVTRTLPVLPAPSLQAKVMAQDANGNALVRWASGPLDSAGQPTQGGLLRFISATQAWSALSLPNALASPNLLANSGAVFDSNGRAWLIQPTPGTAAGEWTLVLYSLVSGASGWTVGPQVPASTPRASAFQMVIDGKNRLVVAHSPSNGSTLSVSRFDPNGTGWSDLPAPTLSNQGYRLSVDAPGNLWALGTTSAARYDNASSSWTGPKNFDFTPADAQQGNGEWPLALAADSLGNTWAVGVRRKAAGQDLPVLWINLFSATTRQWSEAGSLAVQGGDNSAFVQPSQGLGPTFQVALGLDKQNRPVAAVTEILRASASSYQARTWIARGQSA